MEKGLPNRSLLEKEYGAGQAARVRITRALTALVEKAVSSLGSHVTVIGRAKSFASYYRKYIRYLRRDAGNAASVKTPHIPDKIGIRIICPFVEDIGFAEAVLSKQFDVVEVEKKGAGDSFKEFSYQSTHLLIKVPDELRKKYAVTSDEVAEIQIRTILQEAWAEVEHELVYKAEFTLFDNAMKRKLAAVNASLTLADTVFQEIRAHQRQRSDQLAKRHSSFYGKVEDFTDKILFETDENQGETAPELASCKLPAPENSSSIDDLLLNALYAHNKGLFDEAIGFYSKIFSLKPEPMVASLIYKHRGMACFAESHYEDAIRDFTESFKADESSYRSLYYRGLVYSVTRQYEAAIKDFSQSLELHPYQHFCLYRRALAYYHLEDYTEAAADCETVLAMKADFALAEKLRTLVLQKLKM
jgi:putative GTP pyrophosphokinase